tara:strand:+ start:2159 stop:2632 length:474 start_codon:yes stop_codon:yes gene_type:complete
MNESTNKRDRKERFRKVSKRRLDKAVEAIRSLGKLSNTNYVYSEKEVIEIFAKLNFEVKDNLSKFSTGFSDRKPLSAEEKFLRLIELDRYQLMELKKTDPDVYDYALKHLPNSSIQIMPDEEDDRFQEKLDEFSQMISEQSQKLEKLMNKFEGNGKD